MRTLALWGICVSLAVTAEILAVQTERSISTGELLKLATADTFAGFPAWTCNALGAALTTVVLASVFMLIARLIKSRRTGRESQEKISARGALGARSGSDGSRIHTWLRFPAKVIYWIIAPVMWLIYLPVLPLLMFTISAEKGGAVRFVSFSRLVYVWPLCMVGYVLWPLHHYGFIGDMPALVIRDVVIAIVIFTLAINVRLVDAVIICLGVGVAALGDAVYWMGTGDSIWRQVFHFYVGASLGHEYPADLMFRLSHFWALIFAAEYITALVSRRYAITFNDVRKYKLIGFDRIAGATRRLRFQYHGLMDYVLLLAGGSVELLNAKNVPYHRISNVAMLFLYQGEIERRLGSTQVRDDEEEEDEFMEDEDLSDEDALE